MPAGGSSTAALRLRLDRTTRNVYTDGVLSMITDEDLVPFEFADFFDDEDSDDGDDAPSSQTISPDYIKRHISRIPHAWR